MRILLIGHRGCFGTQFKDIALKNKKITLFYPSSKQMNITDFSKVYSYIKKKKPDVVINAASIVGINQCEKEFSKAFEINSASVLNLAKICKKNKILFVQTSTHAVFDGKKKSPYLEKDFPLSNNIYSASKLIAEHFTKSICQKFYIFRFPTMYGKRKNNLPGFVDKVIFKLKKNEKLFIAKDKLDSPSYAKDVANAVLNVILKKKKFGTYHVSNSGNVNYYYFVCQIKKLLGSKSKILPVKDNFFKSDAEKPLRNAIKSIKLKKMRHWKLALKDYIASL